MKQLCSGAMIRNSRGTRGKQRSTSQCVSERAEAKATERKAIAVVAADCVVAQQFLVATSSAVASIKFLLAALSVATNTTCQHDLAGSLASNSLEGACFAADIFLHQLQQHLESGWAEGTAILLSTVCERSPLQQYCENLGLEEQYNNCIRCVQDALGLQMLGSKDSHQVIMELPGQFLD